MPRPPAPPATVLGAALQKARGDTTLSDLSEQLGISQPTLSRVERGAHAPSVATALALAKWLGWSMEAVIEAAGKSVEHP